jgi:NAD(P)H-hydrate epimerase
MPLPVITIEQMREWEKASWAAGRTEAEVITKVGRRVAECALNLTRANDPILVLAGKGNNGADAKAACGQLPGRQVRMLSISEPGADLAQLDALLAERPELIIDGLFGIGLDRPLGPDWIALIRRINDSKIPVLAVDVPSGLDADSGAPQGAAIQAAVTLTVGAPKRGMLLESAWPYVGRLMVADNVGLIACPAKSEMEWILPSDFHGFPPPRAVATHKGTYGHAAIVAGSLGFHGAAVLATRAAQRAQPGLVTTFTMESAYHAVAAQLQAAMVSPWVPNTKMPAAYDCVLVGPGLASPEIPDTLKLLVRLLWRDAGHPVIVDASALDWVPLDPVAKGSVRVLTPHPGEAARLLRSTIPQVQANRAGALRTISQRFGNAWVVLKGHQTLVGRGSGPVYVNSSGNPYLAQGGSGDALGGYLAGLLAQPEPRAEPWKAVCHAVWQHGAAADALQEERGGWTIEDLIERMGRIRPSRAG